MLWSDIDRLWDPWNEFDQMRRSLFRPLVPARAEFPAVNVWTASDSAVVTTEVPGIDPKDIDIAVAGKAVTIRGSREPDELKEGDTYHRRERWNGKFSKTFDLPFNIQTDKVNARFSKGVLTISLPRAEAEKPRKIEITSE
jgi:HSP20 family protein